MPTPDQSAFWTDDRPGPWSFAALVRRLAALRAQRDALDDEAKVLAAEIRGALGSGTHHLDADTSVAVAPIRRFDPRKAMLTLPAEWIERLSVPAIDPSLAKTALPKDLYEDCLSESGWTVRPKL